MKLMTQFEVILKNDSIPSYQRLALIILIFNLSVFIYLSFYDAFRIQAISAIALIGIFLLARKKFIKDKKRGFLLNGFLFFVLTFCWLAFENYILVATCFLIGILYFLALQKLSFVFSEHGIKKESFPKKQFPWNELSNVLLKDQILTLDFKNNKLLQAEIEPLQNVDEVQFNAFAKSQIESANSILNQ